MDYAKVTGILEKHTLPDVIKLLFRIEAERNRQENDNRVSMEEPSQRIVPVESAYKEAKKEAQKTKALNKREVLRRRY